MNARKEDVVQAMPDNWDRFRAPARVAPQCSVSACDRDNYAMLEGYQNVLLCAEHYCRFYLVTLLFLGDAHAVDKWQDQVNKVAEDVGWGAQEDGRPYGVLGVGPGTLPATVVSRPEEWKCSACGGGMSGGYARGYWAHSCNPMEQKESADV